MNSRPSADQFDLELLPLSKSPERKGAVLLGGAFVILVALLLSGSRGGITATGLGLFVLAALTLGCANTGCGAARGYYYFRRAFRGGNFSCFWRYRCREDRAGRLRRRKSHGGLHDHDEIDP